MHWDIDDEDDGTIQRTVTEESHEEIGELILQIIAGIPPQVRADATGA